MRKLVLENMPGLIPIRLIERTHNSYSIPFSRLKHEITVFLIIVLNFWKQFIPCGCFYETL